jgi:formiminotetrahydrofolate cyclodeaminase
VGYGDVPLDAWLDRLAGRSPAPAGGSACALGVAIAAGLASMVAAYSQDRVRDANAIVEVSDAARRRAIELAAADEAAYRDVLHATSAAAREAALAEATRIPLAMVALAVELSPTLIRLHKEGDPRLRGDAAVGIELARAAGQGAAGLVRLNVESLRPEDRAAYLDELASYEERLAGGAGQA